MVFDSCFGFDGVALSRAAADFSILSISLSLISTKQFSRIRNYVEETFRKRAEDSEAFGKSQNKDDGIDHSNTSRNRLPPHFAESLPAGLILAGGVNADDHEETFASLAKFLAKSDFHCALLQSKDVKTRKSGFGGGIGGGGMNSSAAVDGVSASSAA